MGPAFLTIYAKFSDIMGRKTMMLVALALFTVFSIVCGAVSDMTLLCVPILHVAALNAVTHISQNRIPGSAGRGGFGHLCNGDRHST